MNEPEIILDMLGLSAAGGVTSPRALAVVGLSDDPFKASHSVSAYMQRQGYRILPVNPGIPSALGETSYPSLRELLRDQPVKPDVVNVFRLPQHIPAIVGEMVELGLKNLWVQLGIRNPEAAARAEQAGIRVVMDRCILIEHNRLAGH